MIDIILYILLIFIVIIIVYIIFNFLYDYLSYKTDNSKKLENTNKNFNIIDNNINKLYTYINNNDKNIINNYSSLISSNYNILNSNISLLSNNDKNLSSNIFNFDNALKKYFVFNDNSNNSYNAINTALYNYTFNSGNTKLLNIMSKVNAISGMTILTAPSLTNSNNLRICDNSSTPNCLNISVSNSNFNIMPENTNASKIIMNNLDGTKLATFDMNNNTIKLGQNEKNNDSAMYIVDDNVYVKNINFVNDNNFYNDSNIKSFNSTNSKEFNVNNINSINELNNNVICYYNITTNPTDNTNILNINFISEIDIPVNSFFTIKIPEITQDLSVNLIQFDANKNTPYITYGSFISNTNSIKFTINNTISSLINTTIIITKGFNINSAVSLPLNNIAYGVISKS